MSRSMSAACASAMKTQTQNLPTVKRKTKCQSIELISTGCYDSKEITMLW